MLDAENAATNKEKKLKRSYLNSFNKSSATFQSITFNIKSLFFPCCSDLLLVSLCSVTFLIFSLLSPLHLSSLISSALSLLCPLFTIPPQAFLCFTLSVLSTHIQFEAG